MKLRKLLAVMNTFDNIEIRSIHNTKKVLYHGVIGNVPFYLGEYRIRVDEDAFEFCHICAERLIVYVDD